MNIKTIIISTGLILLAPLQLQAQPDLSLDRKIGQMITVGFRGMEVDSSSRIVNDIKKYHIGGVILFDYDVPTDRPVRNIRSAEQVRDLTADLQMAAETPLFIAIDQEGGKIARLKESFGFPETVSAAKLGEIDHPDTTRHYAARQARLLERLGINVNFAPVVDLNTNPENPVIGRLNRSFSHDPEVVVRHAKIFINTYKNFRIMPVVKHFPGHGSSSGDTHEGWVEVTGRWSETELQPYLSLINEEGIPAIMTAHVFNAQLDSTYPATLSKATIQGILRKQLAFRGVVFSDDMQMKAIRSHYDLETAILNAIEAGVDQLVFANNSIYDPEIARTATEAIQKLVNENTIDIERINRSCRRIMEAKRRFLINRKH